MTAIELETRLKQDPAFPARQAAVERERALYWAGFSELQQPILEDFWSHGISLTLLGDALTRSVPLGPEIVELMLKWIGLTSDTRIGYWLVRPLVVVEERFDGKPLTVLFERTSDDSLRWQIGNVMTESRPFGITDWLIRAVENQAYGDGRQMLVLALARLAPKDVAQPILHRLLKDLPGFVALAWKEIGAEQELSVLEQGLAEAKPTWVKKEFLRAIKKITQRLNAVPRVRH